MRRRAYPYGRYLVEGKTVKEMGPRLKKMIETYGFPCVKYDTENEEKGTLIIAVNKKIGKLLGEHHPPGRLRMILAGFSPGTASFRETDMDSQRVGIEIYLWPVEEGVLMELFVLPYMEMLNRPEIYGLTESKEEEITDWYLCERTWDYIFPKLEGEFDLELVHRRG